MSSSILVINFLASEGLSTDCEDLQTYQTFSVMTFSAMRNVNGLSNCRKEFSERLS